MHEPGKIDLEFFERVIAPRLGARRDDVIVPPKNGVDCGIVQVGDRVMALTTDPFYIVPQYGWDKAAWFAFHIIASDLCTSGLKPDFMTIDLNLPLDIEDEAIEKIMETVSREAKKLDCAIVTGHTARYSGVNYPMVGGATMIGVGEKDRFVTPEMARPGDRVIMTKTAALEAAVILSHTFPEYIGANLSEYDVKMLQKLFFKMSTVIESMEASKFGLREHGVTAMHDATEGGVLGALFELAEASGVGLDIEGDAIPVYEEVKDVCDLFEINPYISISEGTLILTAKEEFAEDLVEILRGNFIDANIIGKVTERSEGKRIRFGQDVKEIKHPGRDPFWKAMDYGMSKGLR